jgi:hypothetical protein
MTHTVVVALGISGGEVVAHVEHLAYSWGFEAFAGNHVYAFFFAVLLVFFGCFN